MNLLELPHIKKFAKIFAAELDNFYIIGGAVRDSLLQLAITDIDFATNYTPEELSNLCQSKNIKHIPTGIKYGTITIIIAGNSYEITSFREDIKTDGRHAVVKYTNDLKLDSARRDFTINGLYLDFSGNIFDFHDGKSDIEQKIIRFIGASAKRINEDNLRILRLFRFYAKLANFTIEESSLKAAIAAKEKLQNLSGERITQELRKTLSGANYYQALELLAKHQIYGDFINFSSNALEIIASYKHHNKLPPPYEILLALFIVNSTHPQESFERLKKRLRFSNKEMANIYFIISNIAKLPQLHITPIEIRKLLFRYGREKLLLLYQYQILLKAANPEKYQAIFNLISELHIPIFPVSGKDLLKLNINQGKNMGLILQDLQEKWLVSNFSLSKTQLINSLN